MDLSPHILFVTSSSDSEKESGDFFCSGVYGMGVSLNASPMFVASAQAASKTL